MRRKMLGVLGAVVVASLAMSSSALARAGDRTVEHTYPAATTLCARAHAGTLPRKLAPQSAAVTGACDTLVNAFAPLQSTVDAAEAAFLTAVSGQKALVAAACKRPVSDHAACQAARGTARTTIANAAKNRLNAATTYRHAI
ncbi:MAG TPA: hypothetical protein VMU73_12405, partial [Gaiellaceae bacterium]|nr:hypothetical protein [Gaiellaceae bacterium]